MRARLGLGIVSGVSIVVLVLTVTRDAGDPRTHTPAPPVGTPPAPEGPDTRRASEALADPGSELEHGHQGRSAIATVEDGLFEALFLTGRARDEDGGALDPRRGAEPLWLDVFVRKEAPTGGTDATAYVSSERVAPDSSGAFRIDSSLRRAGRKWRGLDSCTPRHRVALGELDVDAYLVFSLRRGAWPRGAEEPVPSGGRRVGRLDRLGRELDLGELSIDAWPALVAGRVLDTLDRPIADARVTAIRLRGPDGREVWKPLDELGASDADGWFSIRSRERPRVLRLIVSASGYEAELLPFVPADTRNVRVALRTRTLGGLTGMIALEPGLSADELVVWLRDAYENFLPAWPTADGRFAFSDTLIGDYRLEVRTRGTGFLLAHVDDVRVLEGRVASDARTDAIDLHGRAWRLQATLLAGDRTRYGARRVRVEDDSGQGGVIETREDGTLVALVPRATEQLWAEAPGYRRESFMHHDTLVLRP